MPDRSENIIDFPTLLLALTIVSVWGFSFVAINISLKHINPGQLVALRFIPVFLVFLPVVVLKWRKIWSQLGFPGLLWMFFLGMFAVGAYNIALNTGQTYLPASLAALVIALNPASIAIISALTIREIPSFRTWTGLFAGLMGILLIILNRNENIEIRWIHLTGVIITLGAPISWGIYSAGLRHFVRKIGAMETTALSISLGSFPFLLYPVFDRDLIGIVLSGNLELIWSIVFLSIGCTVFGFTAYAILLKRLEAAKAGMFIYLVPLIAAFGSYWILRESIDIPLIIGAIIVLGGVWIASGRKLRLFKKSI